MFTGIVESRGTVRAVRAAPGGRRLTIDCGGLAEGIALGASVAVDGACLTVCGVTGSCLDFDVMAETLRHTTLGDLQVNDQVNLERPLGVGDRLDGHFVQGHIDGKAEVARREVSAQESVLWFRPAAELLRFVIPKGSVAINGVSLTVAAVQGGQFSVALIPTTIERTGLADLKPGEQVNLETDILTRTVVHTIEGMGRGGGVSEELLREHGYL